MRNNYIYFHRKFFTGEIFYIGKGTTDRAFHAYNRNIVWNRIVKKHKGFKIQIFKDNLTEREAFQLEIELISKYKPKANLTSGGEGSCGQWKRFSKERKLEISKKKSLSMMGKNRGPKNGMYGIRHTEEQKRLKSIQVSGKNHPQYGIHKSEEAKNKMRLAKKNIMKKVICLETNQIFESIVATAKYFNIGKANLSHLLKGRTKSARGLHFKFYNEK